MSKFSEKVIRSLARAKDITIDPTRTVVTKAKNGLHTLGSQIAQAETEIEAEKVLKAEAKAKAKEEAEREALARKVIEDQEREQLRKIGEQVQATQAQASEVADENVQEPVL